MNDILKSRQSKHVVNISPATGPEHRNSTLRHSNSEKSDSKLHLYHMKPRYLIDYHVEKPVQFIGEVVGVSPDLDVTNRTDVLRIVDKGKQQGVLSSRVTPEHYALLCLSVFHIEISKFHTSQDLVLRIPMHEVAAVCYIKDDQQHLLAFKFGTQESCKLALMLCESRPVAEEICTLVSQCFTLVYNEATISSTERHPSTSSTTESTLLYRPGTIPYLTDFPRNFKVPSDSGSGRNSFSDTGAGKELLDDYMKKLTTKLSPEELRQFLQHLNDWKSDSPFPEFCDEVLHLLGDERKQLLSDLLPFIPADNYPYFEEFLRRNDIQILDTTSTLSSSRTDLRTYSTSFPSMLLSEVEATSVILTGLFAVELFKGQLTAWWEIVQHMQSREKYTHLHPLHLSTNSMEMSIN